MTLGCGLCDPQAETPGRLCQAVIYRVGNSVNRGTACKKNGSFRRDIKSVLEIENERENWYLKGNSRKVLLHFKIVLVTRSQTYLTAWGFPLDK